MILLSESEIFRAEKIIREVINLLRVDLSGYTVLTEAGSGYFALTPIIASLANAQRVYAWTRDSSYGRATDIIGEGKAIMRSLHLNDTIEYSSERQPFHVAAADIITNLGFVRPLDKFLLAHARENRAVIPLMYEAWEIRKEDIELDACRTKGIKVAGTWENHPDLKIFNGCGTLAVKMANEAGFEVYQNNILIWSDDRFGEVIRETFINSGARSVIKTTDSEDFYNQLRNLDFVFICDYDEKRPYFGKTGIWDLDRICKLNKGLGIVHLYGDIEAKLLLEKGINVYPIKTGKVCSMSCTLAHLGMLPIINLHTAGLKVGECLLKKEQHALCQPIV